MHGDAIEVSVGFQPDAKIYEKKENDVTIDGNLTVSFLNSIATQKFPLTGIIYQPQLGLSTSNLGFGQVDLGEKKTLTFIISNKTPNDVNWELVHVPISPSRNSRHTVGDVSANKKTEVEQLTETFDYSGVFSFSTKQGVLYSMDGIQPVNTVVMVTFRPEHPVRYQCTFKLSGPQIRNAELTISGTGVKSQSAIL